MIKLIVSLVILISVAVIPVLDNKNKFRLEMLTNGIINKFVILGIVFYITTIDVKVGILAFLLAFSLFFTGSTHTEITEGFKNYFSSKN